MESWDPNTWYDTHIYLWIHRFHAMSIIHEIYLKANNVPSYVNRGVKNSFAGIYLTFILVKKEEEEKLITKLFHCIFPNFLFIKWFHLRWIYFYVWYRASQKKWTFCICLISREPRNRFLNCFFSENWNPFM